MWALPLEVIIAFLSYDITDLIVMQKAHINWTRGQGKSEEDLTSAQFSLFTK